MREISNFMRGVAEAKDEEFREAVSIAHMNAGLGRTKKFPKLEKVLPKKKLRTENLTPEQRREHLLFAMELLAKPGEMTKQKVRK